MSETNQTKQLILVTGPARSGKSEWAETLATNSGKSVIYIATAQVDPRDIEWQKRIEQHQQRRLSAWITLEVPLDLAGSINSTNHRYNHCLLIDSLGTWLANCLDQEDAIWEASLKTLLNSLTIAVSDVIIVAEETGWGIVPEYPIGRLFRDRLGKAVREIGAIANTVYLVTAGHALNLSSLGVTLPKSDTNT